MFQIKESSFKDKILEIIKEGTNEDEIGLSFDEVSEYRKIISERKNGSREFVSVFDSSGREMYKLALINDVSIHKLTEKYPKMDELEFEALKYSLRTNWQIEPVSLYRGKIVDGRHRYLALKQIGIPVIKVDIIPNNLTLSEVENIIDAKNGQRRDMNKSQKSIIAYREWKSEGNVPKKIVAKKYAVSASTLSYAEKIEKKLGSEVLDKFLDNGKYTINGKTHKSLTSIVNYISKVEEENNKSIEPKITNLNETTKDILLKANVLKNNGDIESLSIALKQIRKYVTELANE